jgi:hypothetical protein
MGLIKRNRTETETDYQQTNRPQTNHTMTFTYKLPLYDVEDGQPSERFMTDDGGEHITEKVTFVKRTKHFIYVKDNDDEEPYRKMIREDSNGRKFVILEFELWIPKLAVYIPEQEL